MPPNTSTAGSAMHMASVTLGDVTVTHFTRDHYPNGETCVVATDQDQPHLTAYGPDDETASARLSEVRAAWKAFDPQRTP